MPTSGAGRERIIDSYNWAYKCVSAAIVILGAAQLEQSLLAHGQIYSSWFSGFDTAGLGFASITSACARLQAEGLLNFASRFTSVSQCDRALVCFTHRCSYCSNV